jgi:hypothetical protein
MGLLESTKSSTNFSPPDLSAKAKNPIKLAAGSYLEADKLIDLTKKLKVKIKRS